ncbi:unnamed protein product [Rotaria sp. Silwood1]|nr:unnamed protein product [Rotaria sp. Silwood1]CAF4989442.1 unnamed protein product [Rotaria sp. Silwood1]
MASSKISSNDTQDVQQNDSNQTQVTIEQKTAEAIAANGKFPSTISIISPPKQENNTHEPSRDPPDIYPQARCLMFFPTSGCMGFEKVKVSKELPPIEILREMIAYETSIRLSDPIQELMDVYHKDESALRLILDLIQQHVVEHFEYNDFNALRTALYRFPDDPAKIQINIMPIGTLQVIIVEGCDLKDRDLVDDDTIYFNVYDTDIGDRNSISIGKFKWKHVFDEWVKLPAKLDLSSHGEIHVIMNFIGSFF